MPSLHWRVRDRVVPLDRPLVMGILNVTPDSFSDGGQFFDAELAVARGLEMIAEGADILDIGGESTRPYAQPVTPAEEIRRVVPVVRALAERTRVLLSLDTSKAEVARQGLTAGAHIVNDVTALRGDAPMFEIVREANAGAILMHMQGTPATMQDDPHYDDVLAEVHSFLAERVAACVAAGIAVENLAIDPGIGFGKTNQHSLTLIRHLDQFLELGRPLCLGVSRKGFIGKITGRARHERAAGSVAITCWAAAHGAADIVRVHDVAATVDAMRVIAAIRAVP